MNTSNRDQKADDSPQRRPEEPSGSTGRHTGKDVVVQNKDTGQDRYGQSGCASEGDQETKGQEDYRKSGRGGGSRRPKSNQGSGRADESNDESVGATPTDRRRR